MSSHYSPIPIINRMSSLLNSILASPNGLRANELLRTENIPKTTLYRLLTSMTENELLTYIPTSGVYTLGPKFTAAYTSMDERAGRLREAAMPHLRFLAEQVQETVKLTVLSGMQSYTIASVEGTRPGAPAPHRLCGPHPPQACLGGSGYHRPAGIAGRVRTPAPTKCGNLPAWP